MTEFSIIVTSYFEENSIDEFVERTITTMRNTGRSFELVLVNDGSTDATFARHRALFDQYPEISHAIDLYRNTGQICAMACGIAHASGDNFVFIDSDLQLDPEELPMLIAEFDTGLDIVSGRRAQRADSWRRKIPSWIANKVMARVAKHPLTDFGCTFKIYRGSLVRAFGFGAYKPWKTAFVFRHAGRVKEVDVTHHERRYGESGWTTYKLASFLFDNVTGIASRPFLLTALAAGLFGLLVLLRLLIAPLIPGGFLPQAGGGLIINVILLSTLINMVGFSAVGEYVFRIHARTENDPIYVIRDHLSKASGAGRDGD